MSLGVIDPGITDLDQGFQFGIWPTGPWLGYKTKGEEYYWISGEDVESELQRWTHTCFTFSLVTGTFRLVENGKVIFERRDMALKNLHRHLAPIFNFVSVGCSYRNDDFKFTSMHGKLTDVQAWEKELGNQTLMDITNCRNTQLKGNLLNWEKTHWTFETPRRLSEIETLEMDEICQSNEHSLIFLPHLSTFQNAAQKTCKKFSGEMASYMTKSDFVKIQHFTGRMKYFKNRQCLFSVKGTSHELVAWLGLTDDEEEGRFRNIHLDKVPEYLPWYVNRPTAGGKNYNCLVISISATIENDKMQNVSEALIKDDSCDKKRCSICKIPKAATVIKIRGLCKESMYDTTYIYTVSEQGKSLYVGMTSSAIWYDSEKHLWTWTDRKDETAKAISQSRLDRLFLGVNTVNFQNTSDICSKEIQDKTMKIKLTSCLLGNQFTCNDGQCISMDQRCDQTINCNDGSDEKDCKMLDMGNNYNRKMPPILFDSKSNKIIPTEVSLSLILLSIIKIEEVDHQFILKFLLILEWFDHRLNFYNLSHRRSANAIAYEEMEKIWIPNLIFSNTNKNEVTVVSKLTVVTITREGNYTRSSQEIIEETNIFYGKENKLTFEMTYTKVFQCEYQLANYPFDTQTCTVDVTVSKLERQSLVLTPKTIQMLGKVKLTQYFVTSWKLEYRNSSNKAEGIQLSLNLKRRIINAMLTTYLPTTIILAIVYCTNYFKVSHFNTSLTINLTSMLVLTTLFIGVANSLPRVAYIKGGQS